MVQDENNTERTPWYRRGMVRLVKGGGKLVFWEVVAFKNAIVGGIITLKNAIYWWLYYNHIFASLVAPVFFRLFANKRQEGDGLTKFVLVTRGRSGSTAVIDELGKMKSFCMAQERFLLYSFSGRKDQFLPVLLPFDLWKRQGQWWRKMLPACCRDLRQAHLYLTHMEELAKSQGAEWFGWKVLSHQFHERPYLASLLKHHGYRVMYLRRNIVGQVLSGMVANQRGIYNSLETVVDERRYHINLQEFQWNVQLEQDSVKRDCARLKSDGFDFIDVTYEDYCDNREVFFGKICNLLDLPLSLPPRSDYKKVIKDLRLTIENYDEVAAVAASLGEAL